MVHFGHRWCCLLIVLGCIASLIPELRSEIRGVRLYKTTYYDLRDVAENLGMDHTWVDFGKDARLKSRWSNMDFALHQRKFLLNDLKISLGNPVALHRGVLHISRIDFEKTLSPILTPHIFPDPSRLYRIVIDPGHGGKDAGAENRALGLKEKILTLDVARRLKVNLEAYGYEVHLTRSKDTYVPLKERARYANRVKADLFISIHFNATESSNVQGIECYTFTPQYQPSSSRSRLHSSDKKFYPANKNDTWNQLAGFCLQKKLVRDLGSVDRGLKRARWTVLRELECPGVLVELGFVTSRDESKRMVQSSHRQKLADSLTRGVLFYQKKLNELRQT